MSRRLPALPALAAAAVLVLGPSACGSADTATPAPAPAAAAAPTPAAGSGGSSNAQACDDIRRTVTDLSQKAQQQQQGTDAAAAVQTYRDGAAAIRRDAENADADVRRAADKMADQFDKLADVLVAVSQGKTPQTGDLGDPAVVGQELRQACGY